MRAYPVSCVPLPAGNCGRRAAVEANAYPAGWDGRNPSPGILKSDPVEIRVCPNGGSGNLAAPLVHQGRDTDAGSDQIECHDFDGDGVKDLIFGRYETGYSVMLRAGTSNPKTIVIDPEDSGGEGGGESESSISMLGVNCLDIGNLDGDAAAEIVVGDDFANEIILYKQGNPFEE